MDKEKRARICKEYMRIKREVSVNDVIKAIAEAGAEMFGLMPVPVSELMKNMIANLTIILLIKLFPEFEDALKAMEDKKNGDTL